MIPITVLGVYQTQSTENKIRKRKDTERKSIYEEKRKKQS